MLNKIISLALNNRLVVLAAAVLVTAVGLYTANNMDVDVFPDLNAPTVVVMTEAAGMAPEEVEKLVTFPVETALNGATNVRRVRSSSTTGFSVVWVEFDWNTDVYKARQIVSEKIAVAAETLPKQAGKPTLGPQSSILGELLIIGLTADSTSMMELRTTADRVFRPRLLSTGGVAQVTVIGGDVKEYQILLDPNKMRFFQVTVDETLQALDQVNQNAPAGILYQYGNEYIVSGNIATNKIAELNNTVVKQGNNNAPAVLLEHIANVQVGSKAPKLGAASNDAKPAVLITVTKQPETNTLKLTKLLDQTVEELKEALPPDVHVSTDIFRQARFIENAVGNVQKSLLEGSIFVVIILFVFLMNVRSTLISLVTIPLALLVSIITLNALGLTINTMSLGGMAISIGSLVDDAIVDVENVFSKLRENNSKPTEQQAPIRNVVYQASKEVRAPIFNSTLIIVAGFVPLFFLSGMEGKMLAPLGIAFIVALAASTVVALTLTPVLCSFLPNNASKNGNKEPFVAGILKKGYLHALHWTLNHRKSIVITTAVIVTAAVATFFTLGRSFLPPFNEGSFTVNVSVKPGIALDEADKIATQAEKILLGIPEIITTGRKTGRAELDEHSFGVNVSEIEAPFSLNNNRSKDQLIADIRHQLEKIPGANIEIGQPISHRIDHMISGSKANIAIKIFGSNLGTLFNIGNQIKATIGNVEGVADLNVEQQIQRPQLKITPNRVMLAKYGITIPQFSETIQTLLAGKVVSNVYENNQVFDLTLKVDNTFGNSAQNIGLLTIDTPDGQKIPLEYVANISSTTGPNTINRENVGRKIVVSANVAGRDLRSTVNEIQQKVNANVKLPDGYFIQYGGQFENEQNASRLLLVASIFAIMVIFLILYGQFNSLTQAAVVLLNLPLALIGGVFIIALTGGVISIPAIIGFISLFGIATRNGLLLISKYNDLKLTGLPIKECIVNGSLDRLNPILMTALCSALALIPLALGSELPGNEIQSPMAKVILGGLLTSTLLNGFIVPIVYQWVHRNDK